MLISFRVENYKSFDSEQCFSMKAGATRNKSEHITECGGLDILRTAAIFGSNASGKSNLVKAIAASRTLILTGFQIIPTDHCRLNPENSRKPTSFEYTVELDGKIYSYGLEIMLQTGEIIGEWLYQISKNGKQIEILRRERDSDASTSIDMDKDDSMIFQVYSREAKNGKVPFLTIMSRINLDSDSVLTVFHRLWQWFGSSLRIIMPSNPTGFTFSKKRNEFTRSVMPSYGTGVSSVEYSDLDRRNYPVSQDDIYRMIGQIDLDKIDRDEPLGDIEAPFGRYPVMIDENGEPVIKKIMFNHNGTFFEYSEESDGSNRLFDLLPILDPEDPDDLTYVIDEIDRSLHPQLTRKFMDDFERLDPNLKRQLIVTTHESRLLDLDLLRRDEMWFIEKDDRGESKIYSLEEFNERPDRRIDKAYLEGRYGAIPCFRKIFPDLE